MSRLRDDYLAIPDADRTPACAILAASYGRPLPHLALDLLEMFHDVIGATPKVIVEQLVIGVEAIVQRLIFGSRMIHITLEFAHTRRGFGNAGIRASGDRGVDGRTERGRLC